MARTKKSSVRMTEDELQSILVKNKGITINNQTTSIEEKLTLGNINSHSSHKILLKPISTKTSKGSKATSVYDIIKTYKNADIQTSVSDTHFSLVLHGARLISINQIFSLLQNKLTRVQVFSYKKNVHQVIHKILNNAQLELKSQGKKLPFFDDSVELTILRQAPRLVDEDAVTTMFKYIIDAFKVSLDNPNGILAEDNPKIVQKIEYYNEKGPYCVGIRIKLIENSKKETYTADKILAF